MLASPLALALTLTLTLTTSSVRIGQISAQT